MIVPSIQDLRSIISFDDESGKIWLGEQRMLMLHASSFGALRNELVSSLGLSRAKGLLMRMGSLSGQNDARLAKTIRPDASEEDMFLVGPQLHALEGIVRVVPIKLELDIGSGRYYGEFYWENSFEAEEHLRTMGISGEPVCWNQIGYAGGYTSELVGVPILFKEIECMGMGDKHCRIVGKPIAEWEDSEKLSSYYSADAIAETLYSLSNQVTQLRSTMTEDVNPDDIIGESQSIKAALKLLKPAADCDVPVLMLGETGVGKDVFSVALHRLSKRKDKPFVAVNCAALPADLIEAELFGVEKGAFTGADQSRAGRFERAHGGTLFLDEVGELTAAAQAKLLRVVQSGEFDRVGDIQTRKVDVRLIAAANTDLEEKVRAGEFRADLLYRINVFPLHIPALRERVEDIPALVDLFIQKSNVRHNKRVLGITDKVRAAFQQYSWPGNVRELENVIERGVILTEDGGKVDSTVLFPGQQQVGNLSSTVDRSGRLSSNQTLDLNIKEWFAEGNSFESLEQRIIEMALDNTDGNVSATARLLGMGDAQLRYRLKKFEIVAAGGSRVPED
jgi:DNA-binding NtrC family response regulator